MRTYSGSTASIEIPALEDRCAIQLVISQILQAIVNNTIDRPRAALLLYGLQLAMQSVDRHKLASPSGPSRTSPTPPTATNSRRKSRKTTKMTMTTMRTTTRTTPGKVLNN